MQKRNCSTYPPSYWVSLLALILSCSMPSDSKQTSTFEVGPSKPFARLEDAYAQARPGDTTLVHPLPDNQPYAQVALYIDQPRITFRAASIDEGRQRPPLRRGGRLQRPRPNAARHLPIQPGRRRRRR